MIVREAKKNLRRHVKSELKKVPLDVINSQSTSIKENLEQLEKFKQSKKVAVFMSMTYEVQTNKIIKACYGHNKSVYLPRCTYAAIDTASYKRKNNHLDMIKVNSYKEVENLKPGGKFKLLEPTEGISVLEEECGLDMIILPGVAFNTQKNRLGHGAGFYDEFLSVYYARFGKLPYLVGVGLNEQLVEKIPTEEHDWRLDCIITANQVIR